MCSAAVCVCVCVWVRSESEPGVNTVLWLQGCVERALRLQRVPGEGGRASLRGPRLRTVQLRHGGRGHGLLHQCSQQGRTEILSFLVWFDLLYLCSLIGI